MILEICLDNSFAVKGSAQIKTYALFYAIEPHFRISFSN
jgi:hypothetical protein